MLIMRMHLVSQSSGAFTLEPHPADAAEADVYALAKCHFDLRECAPFRSTVVQQLSDDSRQDVFGQVQALLAPPAQRQVSRQQSTISEVVFIVSRRSDRLHAHVHSLPVREAWMVQARSARTTRSLRSPRVCRARATSEMANSRNCRWAQLADGSQHVSRACVLPPRTVTVLQLELSALRQQGALDGFGLYLLGIVLRDLDMSADAQQVPPIIDFFEAHCRATSWLLALREHRVLAIDAVS